MQSISNVKLGRLPRIFDPTMPHMSAVRMMVGGLPPIPQEVHNTDGMNPDFGIMLNNLLGDCTCAAAYHAMQVWSFHGRGQELTEPDSDVLAMYEQFCGYRPNPDGSYNAATDNGGVEQDILRNWLSHGVPIQEGTHNGLPGRSKLVMAMEVDPHKPEDVNRAIFDCGLVYIGFNVPDTLMNQSPIPTIWSDTSSDNIIGGHAVVLTGYTSMSPGANSGTLRDVISWGVQYKMTEPFFQKYVDEVYALVHPWWLINKATPFNIPLQTLEQQIKAFASNF